MMANRQTWCQVAGWTVREFDKRLAEGFPVQHRPASRGEEWRIDTVAGIAWIAAQAAGSGEALDLEAERARLAKEQADKTAMANAVTRRELLPADEVGRAVTAAFGRVRTRMLGLPAKAGLRLVGRTNAAEVQATLAAYVEDALNELSVTVVIAKAGVRDRPLGEV